VDQAAKRRALVDLKRRAQLEDHAPAKQAQTVTVCHGLRDGSVSGFCCGWIIGLPEVDRECCALVFDVHSRQQRIAERGAGGFERGTIGGGFGRELDRAIGPGFQAMVADRYQPRHADTLAHVIGGAPADHRDKRQVRAQRCQQLTGARCDLRCVWLVNDRADCSIHVGY